MVFPFDEFQTDQPLPPLYDPIAIKRVEDAARAPFRVTPRAGASAGTAASGTVPDLPPVTYFITPRAGQDLSDLGTEMLDIGLNGDGDGIGRAGGIAAASPRVGGAASTGPIRIAPGTGRGVNRVPARRPRPTPTNSADGATSPKATASTTATPITPVADRGTAGKPGAPDGNPGPTAPGASVRKPSAGAPPASASFATPVTRAATNPHAGTAATSANPLENPAIRLGLSLLGLDKLIRQASDAAAQAHPNDPEGFKRTWAPVEKQIVDSAPKGAQAAAKATCENCAKEKSAAIQQDLDATVLKHVGDLGDFYSSTAAEQARNGDHAAETKSSETARHTNATKTALERKMSKAPPPTTGGDALSPDARDQAEDGIVRVRDRNTGSATTGPTAEKKDSAKTTVNSPTLESAHRANRKEADTRARRDLAEKGRESIASLPADHTARKLIERWDVLSQEAKRKALAEYRAWIDKTQVLPTRQGGRSAHAHWRKAFERRQYFKRIGDNLESGESALVALALARENTTLARYAEDYLPQATRDLASKRLSTSALPNTSVWDGRTPRLGNGSKFDPKKVSASTRRHLISNFIRKFKYISNMNEKEYREYQIQATQQIKPAHLPKFIKAVEAVRQGKIHYWQAQSTAYDTFAPESRAEKIVRMVAERAPFVGSAISATETYSSLRRAKIAFEAGDKEEGYRLLRKAGLSITNAAANLLGSGGGYLLTKSALRTRTYQKDLAAARFIASHHNWTKSPRSAIQHLRSVHGPRKLELPDVMGMSRISLAKEYIRRSRPYRTSRDNYFNNLMILRLHTSPKFSSSVRTSINQAHGFRYQEQATILQNIIGAKAVPEVPMKFGKVRGRPDQANISKKKIIEYKAGIGEPTNNQLNFFEEAIKDGWRIFLRKEISEKQRKKILRKLERRFDLAQKIKRGELK